MIILEPSFQYALIQVFILASGDIHGDSTWRGFKSCVELTGRLPGRFKKNFFCQFFFFLKFTFTIFKSEVQKKYKIKSKDFLFTEFSQSRFHNLFVN